MSGAPAQAALVHPYLTQITGSTPSKPFGSALCGLTVSPTSSNVFVSDPGAGTSGIDVFGPTNSFLGRISKPRVEGEFPEQCSTASNETLHLLYAGNPGQTPEKPEKKVTGKSDAVLVYDIKSPGEPKFEEGLALTGANTPEKTFMANVFGELQAGGPLHVAVEQKSGDVYVSVAEQHVVDVFDSAGGYLRQLTFPASDPLALTTDSNGDLYVVVEAEGGNVVVDEFSPAGVKLRQLSGSSAEGFQEAAVTGIAVDSAGRIYLSNVTQRAVDEFDQSGAFMGTITGAAVPGLPEGAFAGPVGVGVNGAGDVYVADGASEGREAPGSVYVFGPATPEAGPFLLAESVTDVTPTAATLGARIDPTGVDTKYRFEYTPEGGSPINTPEVDAGSGEAIETVSAELKGLEANKAYSYRAIVTAGSHKEEGALGHFTTQTEGAGVTLPDGREWELVTPPEKHGASVEAIKPSTGAIAQAALDGGGVTYTTLGPIESSPESNAAVTLGALSVRGTASWSTRNIEPPSFSPTEDAGLASFGLENRIFSTDLTQSIVDPFRSEPPLSPEASERTPYLRNLNDQACNIKESSCYTPLVTSAEGFADDTTGEPFGEDSRSPFSRLSVSGASPDLSHVVLSSKSRLLTEANGHVLPKENIRRVYEWSAGRPPAEQLQLVSVLPNGELLNSEAQLGVGSEIDPKSDVRHAISNDGSRVFWTSPNGSPPHLYVRDMAKKETVLIDEPEPGAPAPLGYPVKPTFQSANADGSMVFFTDSQKLTPGATSNEQKGKPDLYVARISEEGGKLVRKLKDLSEDSATESADVLGTIAGVGEEGSYVYFVADGALGDGASAGGCGLLAIGSATCNLYMRHRDSVSGEWEAPALVGVLANEDASDWGGNDNTGGTLERLTARVSPNGEYLAFMSDRSLTGYDNIDASFGLRDEEVFRYGAPASANPGVVCVSCNRSGGRPHGLLVQGGSNRPLVASSTEWVGRGLAASVPGWSGTTGVNEFYQSRYLSDKGRVFFDSADSLVPKDTNSKEDVYQYEPNGEGSCSQPSGCQALISSGESGEESAFLDASESGNDVFFTTAAKLVKADTDHNFDVYDAHLCSTSSPCLSEPPPPPLPCDSSEACQGAPPAPGGSPGAPGSASTGASGNVSGVVVQTPKVQTLPIITVKPTRAQQLSKALKACHKVRGKKARAKCEATARKRYGAKKKAKKASKRSSGGRK